MKEPIPGSYEWVVNFDLNSLYPHLIMQYNISPETLLEQKHPSATVDKILKKELTFEMYKDNAVCANGAMVSQGCPWVPTRTHGEDVQRTCYLQEEDDRGEESLREDSY